MAVLQEGSLAKARGDCEVMVTSPSTDAKSLKDGQKSEHSPVNLPSEIGSKCMCAPPVFCAAFETR